MEWQPAHSPRVLGVTARRCKARCEASQKDSAFGDEMVPLPCLLERVRCRSWIASHFAEKRL